MSTNYTEQTWADNDATKPVSATRMMHIEDGIAAVDTAVTGAISTAVSTETTRATAAEAARAPLPVVTAVAYAATITPAVGTAGAVQVLNVGALTGALTLANPTGTPIDGQNLRIRFAQDATGSRVITFGSAYVFGTDVTAALIPSAASAVWESLFTWHAGTSKWRATAIVRGF